ncbi:hypothetical protein MPNT_40105 [Candidatus Methylacidithermus pantelleriae]|uniref:Uncharacterized protein n=1 Tax=Candidatus Methylacidithermus pantelleriae TaxID=2744239 RepID=A0A8J2BJX0_9BACT|nr:hypothetical protein MPNT_40105 [Candidatus Methylacidithermus pantelleriae]
MCLETVVRRRTSPPLEPRTARTLVLVGLVCGDGAGFRLSGLLSVTNRKFLHRGPGQEMALDGVSPASEADPDHFFHAASRSRGSWR